MLVLRQGKRKGLWKAGRRQEGKDTQLLPRLSGKAAKMPTTEREPCASHPLCPIPGREAVGPAALFRAGRGGDGSEVCTLMLPPLGLAGVVQECGGGEQGPPGLELLRQQETGMSGPHFLTSVGSSWWAGARGNPDPRRAACF